MTVNLASGQLLPTIRVSQFFDRTAVKMRLDKATLKYLRRSGGAVRLTARRSIRQRKAISKPGMPPSSHTGLLKNSIFFGLDNIAESASAVVGPSAVWRQSNAGGSLRGASLLEFGGSTIRKRVRRYRNGGRRTEIKHLHYAPRPFLRPALDAIKPKLPQFFAEAYR